MLGCVGSPLIALFRIFVLLNLNLSVLDENLVFLVIRFLVRLADQNLLRFGRSLVGFGILTVVFGLHLVRLVNFSLSSLAFLIFIPKTVIFIFIIFPY